MDERLVLVIVVSDPHVDLAQGLLWQWQPDAIGETALDDGSVELRAGFDGAVAHDLAHRLRSGAAGIACIRVDVEADDTRTWIGAWRPHAVPVEEDTLRIRLPEHVAVLGSGRGDGRPTAATMPGSSRRRRRNEERAIDLVIDPGAAFGYGHPTTLLLLRMLADRPPVGCRVADIGCGTGVLGLAAAQLGSTRVVGVDVDAEAIDVARANAARNLGTAGGAVGFTLGSIEALPEGTHDVVLANLTIGDLAPLLGRLVGLVAAGGELLVSGLLGSQCDRVVEDSGLEQVERRLDGEWGALRLRATVEDSPDVQRGREPHLPDL